MVTPFLPLSHIDLQIEGGIEKVKQAIATVSGMVSDEATMKHDLREKESLGLYCSLL